MFKKFDYQPSQIISLAIAALLMALPTLADSPQAGFKGSGGSGAPTTADYWVGTANGSLSAEIVPSGGTGISVVPTTGVISIASPTARTDQGNSFSAAQIPNAFGTIDLGSTTFPFKDLYLGNGGSNYTLLRSGVLTGNRTVTFPDANSNTVQPDTGAANNFLTAISSAGVISKAQPAFSNLTGTATIAQGGTNNGSLSVAAGAIPRGDGTKLTGLALGTALQQIRVNAGATDIEYFTPSAASGGFTMFAKSGSFSANDAGSQNFYRNAATGTITLPAATGSGVVKKFLQTAGTGTFAFTGGDVVRHASGTSDTSLTQGSTVGTIELIDSVSGVWDET